MIITSSFDAGRFAGISALQSREPGYAVARECLSVQAKAEQRDPTLRTETGVRLHADAWPWYVGALGEIEVGSILSMLGPEWFARHAVPIGTGTTDVDHLLIGPNGIFALNTKRHLDRSIWVGDYVLRVNGSNTPHLSRAKAEADNVAERLSRQVGFPVSVHSAVVVVGARSVKDARPEHLRTPAVIPADRLLGWITSRWSSLGPTQLELVRLAAEEPETWHIDPHAAETFRVMPRFQRLREEVGDNPVDPRQASAPVKAKTRRTRSGTPQPSSRGSRRARTASAPLPSVPAPSRRTPKVHRSRAERLFWKLFFGFIGVPVLLFLFLVIIATLESVLAQATP